MKKADSYDFIAIGLFVRYLQSPDDQPRKDILYSIEYIEKSLQFLNFPVTLAGLSELLELRQNLSKSEDKTIKKEEASMLTDAVTKLEVILYAEAKIKKVFFTEDRRYNLQFLLDQPSHLFAENVFANMPDLSKSDLAEGCKCIVFGLPTAAAFHILRATEGILKQYYYHHIRKNREKMPMWKNMVSGLRAKQRNKPPLTLLDSLDLIRASYRNPTNHPEAVYSLEECQDLFGLCIDVVNKMELEISTV